MGLSFIGSSGANLTIATRTAAGIGNDQTYYWNSGNPSGLTSGATGDPDIAVANFNAFCSLSAQAARLTLGLERQGVAGHWKRCELNSSSSNRGSIECLRNGSRQQCVDLSENGP